jgi:hypothetical protein
MGTANPAACRVGTLFIVKDAFQDKNFFASKMSVGIELGIRLPLHQGYILTMMTMQRHNREPFDQSRKPGLDGSVDRFLFTIVGAELV